MTRIAASAGVSMPVSMRGTSIASSIEAILGLMSAPPSTVPRLIEATVRPSIQPLASTSFSGGSSSVRIPYFAGEFDVAGEEQQRAPGDLDGVGDEHHAALGDRVGEGSHERGEHDVGHGKEELQQRYHPRRAVKLQELGDRGDQQRVVGERAEELRRHDGVEAAFHRSLFVGRRSGKRFWPPVLYHESFAPAETPRAALARPPGFMVEWRAMRPIRARIDFGALRHNLGVAKRRAPRSRAWAVVKANAYGHGLARSAKALAAADGLALIELD